LTLLAGPQRLEVGWLEGEAALRDYYVARSVKAGLLWVYRERLGAQAFWYLHGIFA
jgi:protein ImuB